MTHLPMFPLGAVLFPSMPLALRVFEQRYLEMLAAVLQDEPPEFGVVLIERGQEVGGGDARFGIGTVARVSELNAGEGFIAMIGVGVRRIEIVEWLDEAPYPVAEVREMASLEWTEDHREQLDATERAVRSALAVASEFADLSWSADVEIAAEPVAAAWQLAAIAPLGAMDQVALLGATTIPQLLDGIREGTESALDQLRFAALDDEAPDDE